MRAATLEEQHQQVISTEVELLQKYHDLTIGLPEDIPSLKALSRTYHRNVIESIYDHGRVLLLLKVKLAHGEFSRHLDDLQIQSRWAQRCMQFAQSCSEIRTLTNGKIDFEKIKHLGQVKGQLLLNAALENPEELAENGTIAGRHIDEYDGMSRDEIKKRLGEFKHQIEKGKEQVAKLRDTVAEKNERIAFLTGKTANKLVEAASRFQAEIASAFRMFDAVLPSSEEADEFKLAYSDQLALANCISQARSLVEAVTDRVETTFPDAHAIALKTEFRGAAGALNAWDKSVNHLQESEILESEDGE